MTGSTAAAVPSSTLPAGAPLSAAMAHLMAIVDRVASIVDAETEALSHAVPPDIAEFNHRKRHALLELTRGVRAFGDLGSQDVLRDCLGPLAEKLERNRRALDTRLRAVREIADIIAQTIRDSESDGTYSLFTARQ